VGSTKCTLCRVNYYKMSCMLDVKKKALNPCSRLPLNNKCLVVGAEVGPYNFLFKVKWWTIGLWMDQRTNQLMCMWIYMGLDSRILEQKIWLHAFENICMASSRPCAVIVELHHLIDKIGSSGHSRCLPASVLLLFSVHEKLYRYVLICGLCLCDDQCGTDNL